MLFSSFSGFEITFITPCIALAPYLELAGPVMVSMPPEISKAVSKRPFTLQKPAGLTGIPSSKIKNEPQAPGPVSTGDRMAVKCS